MTPRHNQLQRAQDYLAETTTTTIINVHPSMLAYVTPLTIDKDGDLILSIPDVNHNELNPQILYEIINNTIDNICNMQALKVQDMGQDMVMFAIKWNKVSS